MVQGRSVPRAAQPRQWPQGRRSASSPRGMPSLKITASAQARRRARRLLRDDRAHRLARPARALPSRAATCVASLQSTTSTRSTRLAPVARLDQQRHVEDEHAVAGRGAAWRSASAPISGCRMASSRASRAASAKASSRMRSRSSAPSASMTSAPKAARIGGDRGAAGQRQLRARSHRCRRAPRRARPSSAATVLLPLPMPPVRPMRSAGVSAMARADASQAQPIQPSTRVGPASITTRPAPARNGPKGT